VVHPEEEWALALAPEPGDGGIGGVLGGALHDLLAADLLLDDRVVVLVELRREAARGGGEDEVADHGSRPPAVRVEVAGQGPGARRQLLEEEADAVRGGEGAGQEGHHGRGGGGGGRVRVGVGHRCGGDGGEARAGRRGVAVGGEGGGAAGGAG